MVTQHAAGRPSGPCQVGEGSTLAQRRQSWTSFYLSVTGAFSITRMEGLRCSWQGIDAVAEDRLGYSATVLY